MNATHLEVALAALALLGQAVNVVLHLRIQNAILQSESKILAKVKCEFRDKEVCDARMDAQDGRLAALEPRPRHA